MHFRICLIYLLLITIPLLSDADSSTSSKAKDAPADSVKARTLSDTEKNQESDSFRHDPAVLEQLQKDMASIELENPADEEEKTGDSSLQTDSADFTDTAESTGKRLGGSKTAVSVPEPGSPPKKETVRRIKAFASSIKKNLAQLSIFKFIRRFIIHISVLAASIAIILFTASFFLKKEEKKRFMTTTRLSVMDKEIQRACKYIEREYYNPGLSLESLCSELVTGPSFLEALFEKELGMSVEDFIAQVRINRARNVLEKVPDSPVDELAVSAGFRSREEFLKTFREIVQIPFEEYLSGEMSGKEDKTFQS